MGPGPLRSSVTAVPVRVTRGGCEREGASARPRWPKGRPKGCPGIVGVLVAGGAHQQAEAQYLGEAVLDAFGRAVIIDAGGEAPGDAEAVLDLTQRQ